MRRDNQTIKNHSGFIVRLLPLFSFIVPIIILYSLYPSSFEQTYQGRTLYLFFLWLVSLEMIMDWEKLQRSRTNRLRSVRTILLIACLVLPTIYVIAANYWGLNTIIASSARSIIPAQDDLRDQHANQVALSMEYMVFAVLFCLMIVLQYSLRSLMNFSLSALFLGIIGVLFTVDNLSPYGRFTLLQSIVPVTAMLAANVLNFMGYPTTYTIGNDPIHGSMPLLMVNSHPWARFSIAWPCSGVESLLIYSVTILLFLKKTAIPRWQKIVYFAIGAAVTYLINILRIVTLFLIAIQKGPTFTPLDYDFQRFHNYYGMLYSMTWIVAYPLIIIGTQALWTRVGNWKANRRESSNLPNQTTLST